MVQVVPEIEGILQDLTLSPDNKYAVAHTNNSLVSKLWFDQCPVNTWILFMCIDSI